MKTIYKIITVCLFVLFIPISLYSMFESKSALPIVSLTELEKKYDDMDVVKQFQLIYPDYSIESGPIQDTLDHISHIRPQMAQCWHRCLPIFRQMTTNSPIFVKI